LPDEGQAIDLERHQAAFVEFGGNRMRRNEGDPEPGDHGLLGGFVAAHGHADGRALTRANSAQCAAGFIVFGPQSILDRRTLKFLLIRQGAKIAPDSRTFRTVEPQRA
jgi:hypothetical protein